MEKKLPAALGQEVAKFAQRQPLRLMFQDEARFGRISDCRRCWCKAPTRPLVRAMLSRQYVYAFAAVSPGDGQLDSLVLPQADTQCMQLFLDEVARRHAAENIVMVLDGAGWHRSGRLRLPQNLRLLFLPPYSPELNPQEHVWDELREKFFHNRVFDSLDAVENALVDALRSLEQQPDRIKSITGWQWIINTVSNAN
jgi:transposase